MKIIIYNYSPDQSILNYFDVFELPDCYEPIESNLPRSLQNGEIFESMTESEAQFLINNYLAKKFYIGESCNVDRYYNPKIYPQN